MKKETEKLGEVEFEERRKGKKELGLQ